MDYSVDGNNNTFRAFLAVELAEETKQKIAHVLSLAQKHFRYRNINWVNPENLHITLRFLGDITQTQYEQLSDAISLEIPTYHASKVILTRLMVLPSRKNPQIIAIVPTPTTQLAALAMSFENIVVACGLPPDERPYQPHLTLAKIKIEKLQHIKKLKIEPIPLEIKKIALFKSKTTRKGSIYTVIKSFDLK